MTSNRQLPTTVTEGGDHPMAKKKAAKKKKK